MESDPFTIDNSPPVISGFTAAREQAGIHVRWHAVDALSTVKKAEYSLDGADWTRVDPVGRLSDSKALDYDVVIPAADGHEHTIAVRVTDDYENQEVAKKVL